MKKTTLTFTILLASFAVSQASITISGTSLFNTEIFNNSEGIYISSNTGSFDESLFTTLDNGTSFATGTVIGDYTVLGSAAVNNATATAEPNKSFLMVFDPLLNKIITRLFY